MKKLIAMALAMTLAMSSVMAFLGTYEPGESALFYFYCLQDGGTSDAACTKGSAYVQKSDASIYVVDTANSYTQITAISKALWEVNYTIPIGDPIGTYTFAVNITNSNGTGAATTESFQVVADNAGINSTGTNVITALSNQAVIQASISQVNNSVTTMNSSINKNINLSEFNLSLMKNINISDLNKSLMKNINLTDLNNSITNGFNNLNNSLTANINMTKLNQSILLNISQSSSSISVSASDQAAIGKQCAIQTLGANFTKRFSYNFSDYSLRNVSTDYESLGLIINETYSMKNNTINQTRVIFTGP